MDQDQIYLEILKLDPAVRQNLIELAGGAERLALTIAEKLGVKVSHADTARVLNITESGSRKRRVKINRKKREKKDSVRSRNAPKRSPNVSSGQNPK